MEFNKIRFFALQCKDIAEFNNSDECVESKKMGVYDEVTKHFHGKKKLYTDDDLYFIASFYEYRKQFMKNSPSAYDVARRRKLLDTICRHMKNYFHKDITKESAIKTAKKYKTRMSLKNSKEDSWAYNYGVRNHCLDEICRHMDAVGNKYYRCIYVYELEETKTCYVGLTYSLHKRHLQHLNDKYYSAINEYCAENNIELPLPIQKTPYIPKDEASKKEDYYVKLYKQNGWNVLNKQKAGNLGGSKDNITYTLELCKKLAVPYTKISDFAKDYITAYKYIRLYGWQDEVFAHIDRDAIHNDAIIKMQDARRKMSKRVFLYDLDGNLKNTYESVTEASKKTGISQTSIYNMCNHKIKYKFFNNQVFLFEGDKFDNNIKEKIKENKKKHYDNLGHKIAKISNNEIIEVFDNTHLAAKDVSRNERSILTACQKGGKCGGFHWKRL